MSCHYKCRKPLKYCIAHVRILNDRNSSIMCQCQLPMCSLFVVFTEQAADQTADDMKAYTLGLLRSEKMFTESFSICTQIIDDIMAQDEEEEEVTSGGGDHNSDKKPLIPYVPT